MFKECKIKKHLIKSELGRLMPTHLIKTKSIAYDFVIQELNKVFYSKTEIHISSSKCTIKDLK